MRERDGDAGEVADDGSAGADIGGEGEAEHPEDAANWVPPRTCAEWREVAARTRRLEPPMRLAARGLRLLERGKAALARDVLTEAVRRFPDDAEMWQQLGLVHHYAAEHDAAIAAYRRALQLDPQLETARLFLAEVLVSDRRGDEALRELDILDGPDPDGLLVRSAVLRARVLIPRRRFEEAEALLREALDAVPDDAPAALLLAVLLSETGRYDEACVVAEDSRRAQPDDVRTWESCALALCRAGRFQDALDTIARAEAAGLASAAMDRQRCIALVEVGRVEEGLEEFRAAAERTPDDVDLLYAWGDTLGQAERLEEALDPFSRLCLLEPDAPRVWFIYGSCLLGQERFPEAEQALQSGLALAPEDSRGWEYLARARIGTGDREGALAAATRSLELRPDDPGALAVSAILFTTSGRTAEARAILERLERVDPATARGLAADLAGPLEGA